MAEATLQLQIPVLLPHVEDERDQCIARLNEQMARQRGIYQAHLESRDGQALVCLHYDANLLTLERVQRMAEQAGARVERRYRHETLRVTGMDCPDCARSLEHILARVAGVFAVSASYAAEKVRVEYDGSVLSHADVVRRIGWLGYTVQEEARQDWLHAQRELLLPALAGVLLAVAFAGQRLFGWPELLIMPVYVLAYVAGGYDAARHGFKAALRLEFDVDLLMVVAALGAAALGNWAEGGLLLFLFSLGHGLEHHAMDRARHAIEALGELTPKTARVRRDGVEQELRVTDLQRGDLVIVRPGERLPVDGQVAAGQSAVDQSPITGESMPVPKGPGDGVFAGTVNGAGALEVTVKVLADDTTLARVVRMVEEAETQKSPAQLQTERFTRAFVPVVLALVVFTIVIPPLVGWLPWQTAFLRGMTVLVAASPCALAIATPAAVLSGVARAARGGVLIKGGVHLENLGRLRALAFDKTGTLTVGRPRVTNIEVTNDGGPDSSDEEADLLALAAAVESRSGHPLAQAINQAAGERGLALPAIQNVQALPGLGLTATFEDQPVQVGNLKMYLGLEGPTPPAALVERAAALEGEGKTVIVVRHGRDYVGMLAVADALRPEAAPALAQLDRLGVRDLVMLTGDNARVAGAVAGQAGLTTYQADLLPEDKVKAVRGLVEEHGQVAMVGDGVNDAPALAAATVGIAMGAGGSDVALETADVALMASDLLKLPFAIGLSRQAKRIIVQNLAIALGMILFLIPAALLGAAGIGLAILLHEGSTIVVVFNALRLLGYRDTSGAA
jgi:Zn2+/Cd2+-exporting ATPase